MSQNIQKAVFPLGGLGTRMLPATKVVSKELLPILDVPLIQYAVNEAIAAGIQHLIFVTGQPNALVEKYFSEDASLTRALAEKGKADLLEVLHNILPKNVKTSFVIQEEPLGLGHAVLCAADEVGQEPFAVLLPDDLVVAEVPCLKQMIDDFESTMAAMVGVMEIPGKDIEKYGVLELDHQSGKKVFATGMVEKPPLDEAPSSYAAIGRYVLSPRVMETLKHQTPGAGGEIQLTDGMANALKGADLCGYLFDGTRYDCGSKEGVLEATIGIAMGNPELKSLVERAVLLGSAA